MKFTHRTVGPRKGCGFSPVTKIKKEPKPRKRADVPKVEHAGAFAKFADAVVKALGPVQQQPIGGASGDPTSDS